MQKYIDKAIADFGKDSTEFSIVKSIIQGASLKDAGYRINFSNLKEWTKNFSSSSVLRVVPYIGGERLDLLETVFIFVDNDKRSHQLSKETVNSALEKDSFVHPSTGELIEQAQHKINVEFIKR